MDSPIGGDGPRAVQLHLPLWLANPSWQHTTHQTYPNSGGDPIRLIHQRVQCSFPTHSKIKNKLAKTKILTLTTAVV